MTEPKPEQRPRGRFSSASRATIVAALITAGASAAIAIAGWIQNSSSGRPQSVVNIVNSGLQVFGNMIVGAGTSKSSDGPVMPGSRVTKTVPVQEAVIFDYDVSASVTQYEPQYGSIVMINGTESRWHRPGARFEAKKDGRKTCFVELMSVSESEKAGKRPSVQFDYFCRPSN